MPHRPHILVFMTDDHAQWASGCYGNRELQTPSMDWLAQTGVRASQAFTPCPVCSPARASFWTGKIPSAHGIHDHIGLEDHRGITGQITLAHRLSSAGYRTGLSGKWHCHAYGRNPQPGFDFWFSQWGGTNAKAGPQPFCDNGRRVDFVGQQAPLITDAAVRFLRDHAAHHGEEPLFLFVGYCDTHSPFATLPERLVSRYRGAALADIPDEKALPVHGQARSTLGRRDARFVETLAQYYAAVSLIDEQVGRVLDEMQGLGQLDDTLVVYTADHGHMNGHHGLLTKGNATVPQNFLDESILVPCLLRHPGRIKSGGVLDVPVDHCDLFATLLDAAGVALPEGEGLAGRSYLPLMAGGAVDGWRDWQIVEYGNARMIRTRAGLKLIRRYPGPNGHFADELYDLRQDSRETRNILSDPTYAQDVRQLDALLDAHFSQWQSPALAGTDIATLPRFNNAEPWRIVTQAAAE